MFRIRLALGLLLFVVASIGAPALAAPVDQSDWAKSKETVRLANGIKLAYVELGDPNGQPLLLLHGYTDTSRSWSLVAPHLSGYRLLIPDQRGHGDADAPECCYGPAQFAFDAKLFLDALGVKRAAVAGHSLGSMVAMSMAAEYPERVAAIVLIGSTALAPVKPGTWLYDQVSALKFPLDRNSAFMREWHPSNQPTPIDPAFAEAVLEDILLIQPHVWRGVMRELTQLPVARHAANVEARVLILSGGKDPLFPAEHHAALLKAFPRAEAHVFPDLGHSPNWEQPAAVAAKIDGFLRSSTGS
jgi:pimeloyl-ACP methyl ester carboxylesterase